MFAVVKNSRVLQYLENPLLCEALARGFAGVAELRAWEAGLPRGNKGGPEKPVLEGVRVFKVNQAQEEQYKQLLTNGYKENEILLRKDEFVGDEEARSRRMDDKLWNTIREKRNALLEASDKYALPDFPLTKDKRATWLAYRQALRDITNAVTEPHAVQWPSRP